MSDGKVEFSITGNLQGINSALNSATNAISTQTAKWTVLGQTAMNALVSAAKAGFNAVKDLALNAFEYNAKMETYAVNFKTLLGSAEAAQGKLTELKEYAAKTPFALEDLADATQTMLAFGLTSEESSLALQQLGDISLGDANKLQSLTLAFSQISSAGKLAGQDLLQMINAGFNPLQVIAEKTGVAYADLHAVMSGEKTSEDFNLRMEAARKEVEELGTSASEGAIMLAQIGKDGMISADMVAAAMRIATSEGGAFYKALESASQTAQGQIATIQDSWDMLTGKVTGGVFDKLSTEVFPKVIGWLDELNAAYDKDGFEGLKGAAGGIFDELGELAFNAGAGLITKLYNGLTGDDKTTEEVKAYLAEIFGAAGDVVNNIKEAGVGFFEWVKDNGELVGGAATAIGIGFGVMLITTHPVAAALTVLAGAIALLTTDWTTFEEKYPLLSKTFEDLTGIDFSDFTAAVEGARTNIAAFYNDAIKPLVDGLSAFVANNPETIQALALTAAGLLWLISPGLAAAVVISAIILNWNKVKEAVDQALTATETFFTQTVPQEWTDYVTYCKKSWKENVTDPIDEAARKIVAFFGLKLPENWSLTSEIGAAWDVVIGKIQSAIDKINAFIGIVAPQVIEDWQDVSDHYAEPEPFYNFSGWSDYDIAAAIDYIKAHAQVLNGDKSYMDMRNNAMVAILQGQGEDAAASFATAVDELFASIENGDPVQLPAEWLEGTDAELQAALSGMNLSVPVSVNPALNRNTTVNSLTSLIDGLFGQDHASGGIFTSATRFLGEDGMHTFGESGTEILMPLDALWRKMGFFFDQTFAANLGALQYSVMPSLPAASPAPRDDNMAETIAAALREAMKDLTIEMDKRTVGRILSPLISKDIADTARGKEWTQ